MGDSTIYSHPSSSFNYNSLASTCNTYQTYSSYKLHIFLSASSILYRSNHLLPLYSPSESKSHKHKTARKHSFTQKAQVCEIRPSIQVSGIKDTLKVLTSNKQLTTSPQSSLKHLTL